MSQSGALSDVMARGMPRASFGGRGRIRLLTASPFAFWFCRSALGAGGFRFAGIRFIAFRFFTGCLCRRLGMICLRRGPTHVIERGRDQIIGRSLAVDKREHVIVRVAL